MSSASWSGSSLVANSSRFKSVIDELRFALCDRIGWFYALLHDAHLLLKRLDFRFKTLHRKAHRGVIATSTLHVAA
jgi:hypothetical protein